MRLKIPFVGVTIHAGSKDGGEESRVWMYGIECKRLASALVLRFEDGSREAYHSHAFNALSWVLSGALVERQWMPAPLAHETWDYLPGTIVWTPRDCTHMVVSVGRTWVLSFRGPWRDTWVDIDIPTGTRSVLSHGRKVVH